MSRRSGVTGQFRGHSAPGGVRDPVGGFAVDGADGFPVHHEGPDIPPRLADELLKIERLLRGRPEHVLVLEEGVQGVHVVDLGQEPSPGTQGRLDHHRESPEGLDGPKGFLGAEGHGEPGAGHSVPGEEEGGDELVFAVPGDRGRIDDRNAEVFQEKDGVIALDRGDRPFEGDVEIGVETRRVENLGPDVDKLNRDAAARGLVQEELLLFPDRRMKDGQ